LQSSIQYHLTTIYQWNHRHQRTESNTFGASWVYI